MVAQITKSGTRTSIPPSARDRHFEVRVVSGSMIALVTVTEVRTAGIVFLVLGVLGLIGLGRRAGAWWLAGTGAAMSTWGLLLLFRSFDKRTDGPRGWSSVSNIFSSTFDSWLWVFVAGAVAGVWWLATTAVIHRRRPRPQTVVATMTGGMVALVVIGLLDPSLAP